MRNILFITESMRFAWVRFWIKEMNRIGKNMKLTPVVKTASALESVRIQSPDNRMNWPKLRLSWRAWPSYRQDGRTKTLKTWLLCRWAERQWVSTMAKRFSWRYIRISAPDWSEDTDLEEGRTGTLSVRSKMTPTIRIRARRILGSMVFNLIGIILLPSYFCVLCTPQWSAFPQSW